MRRSIVLFSVASIILSGIAGCDGRFYPEIPPIYDPDKAGATIVKGFDITGEIPSFKEDKLLGDSYRMALYGENIYINTNGKVLYVFEKNNFTKIDEKNLINLPDYGFACSGITIIDAMHGFLLSTTINPYNKKLLSLDLTTGVTAEIESMEEIGMEPDTWVNEIGYDKENDLFWFSVAPTPANTDLICFFEYISLEGIFTFKKKIEPFQSKFMGPQRIFISGDNLFRTGYQPASHPSQHYDANIGVEKYLISNSEERLYFINAEYLGTKTIPNNIIYDEPYIWMMVERDNQIQMLKLLPNE